jgi:adenine phosphoribosyltransferase
MQGETLKRFVRDVQDFPTSGILFRDITPILQDGALFRQVVSAMADRVRVLKPDVIVGIESRGFILGAPIALELGAGFVPVRKLGKLPFETIQTEYSLEYGANAVEIHTDAIGPGQRAVIVDDLLATGGTAAASIKLVQELGAEVAGLVFLVELSVLNGREKLNGLPTETIIQY